MKSLLTLLFALLLFSSANSQTIKPKFTIGKNILGIQNKKDKKILIITTSCFFVSGAIRGLNETLIYSYPAFESKFPNANQMWWNPAKSWANNYPNGLLFQTMFIAPKDAKHTFDFLTHNLVYVAIPLQLLNIGELRKLNTLQLASRWIVPIAARSLGFELIHKGVFGL